MLLHAYSIKSTHCPLLLLPYNQEYNKKMPSNNYYQQHFQYDARQAAGQSRERIVRRIALLSYDSLRFVINFCGSMIKMVMGK